ncbi:type I polyketide synthase [Candidatus Magnetomonas plexicatena]|uniref:type I polyketide synthase n=1 Tax=Candidatus Magnetomonas plexicatena TaxID=2552947 RepID=UPI001C77DBC7|nr:type I polyketide synthase [Nitrospirales bacterium LBB_01]
MSSKAILMDNQSLMKKALMELKDMRGRLESMEYRQHEPIAIIGLGCRLPGGVINPNSYWKMLEHGTDAITEVPASRWDIDDYYSSDPDAPGKMYCRYGGFLDSVDTFDAHLFGISPKETVNIDPQHRILLEVTWEAIENAAISSDTLYGSNTGVFVGISGFEYGALQFTAQDARLINAYSGVGAGLCVAAGRLSYTFGLTGPSMSIDTACSSSLVATHLAVQSLRRRECNMGIAAGVNLILIPAPNIIFSRARMLSPYGRCKTFDASADGYVRGEGCGVVVLKRLSDALSDGDKILAIIRGSAVNQDGPSGGLTVPSGPAQGRVIRSALSDGGVEPAEVSYIEAHGTGTPLGDPIEVNSLGAVFNKVKSKSDPLIIGTVKTNFGHLEAAAGVAGLIKVVLSIQHGTIPPHLHFKTPNPHIDWAAIPIEVASDKRTWSGKKIAGVSSFGFSGTNAHVVLEESPQYKTVDSGLNRPLHILTLSAKTDEALSELTVRYKELLTSQPDIIVSDFCYTSNVGRNHFNRRRFVIGQTAEEILGGLSAKDDFQLPQGYPKIAFLFTGQGGLTAGMGQNLYENSPVFRDTLTECNKILLKHIDVPLLELMYGGISADVLNETRYAQPVLFCLEYSLYKLWQSWGIEPGALLGHSIGEYTAACVSGVFSLEDALMLVAKRGRLMWEAPGEGTMAAVFASETVVLEELTSEDVSIAAVNGHDSVVISGLRNSVMETCKRLSERGIKSTELVVSHGFHSRLMEPVLESFAKTADTVVYHRGKIPIVSNITGGYYSGEESSDYWVKHLRGTVRFLSGIETLYKDGYRVFVELGPGSVLLSMGKRNIDDKATAWLPSLRANQNEWRQMLKSVGALYVCGMDINWKEFNAPYGYRKVAELPNYPFARKRYWIDVKPRAFMTETPLSLLGMKLPLATGDVVFENEFSYEFPDFIKQHRIYGSVVVPAAVFIEMALTAAKHLLKSETIALKNFSILQPLIISENDRRKVQTLIVNDGEFAFKIFSRLVENTDDNQPWILHVNGAISNSSFDITESLESVKARCTKEHNVSGIYRQFSSQELEYGTDFQAMQKLWSADGEALSLISLSDSAAMDSSKYNIHPIAIDAVLQTAAALIDAEETFLPVGFGALQTKPQSVTKLWSHAKTIFKSDNEIKLNFTVFTEDGAPVMFIEGLTAKKADRTKLLSKTKHDDFLYDIVWERKDTQQSEKLLEKTGQWAIFTNRDGIGEQLTSIFKENGLESVLVRAGNTFRELSDGKNYEINPQSAGDFEKLFTSIGKLTGVVYLWSAGVSGSEFGVDHLGVIGLLHTVQALVKHENVKLMIATRGVWQVGDDEGKDIIPYQSPVWGFGRVLFLEHPELTAKLVDLPAMPVQNETFFLYNELFNGDKEQQVALRNDIRFVCRLKRRKAIAESENTALKLTEYGGMDALKLKPAQRRNPSENEVEIEVKAAGLNFRDVLNALGMLREYSGNKAPQDVIFGFECSGVVSRTGSAVKDIKPGDSVIAAPVNGTFSTYTTVNSNFASPMPEKLSFTDAATVPLTYLTAWYGLIVCGKLKAGERILIHAAAGGVGCAAVQIAKMIGADIYATASRGKWDFLRAQGVNHIMDSRSLDFSDEIMTITQGCGVNMVLNSLNGEYIPKSLRVLSNGGRFIEIGKIGIWTEEEVKRHRPDVSYHSFDMGEVSERTPLIIREMFKALTTHLNSGELKPLFNKVFPITDAVSAFRYMAAAKHVGKVVLKIDAVPSRIIRNDATYIITGGLGALGLELSQWLVEKGALYIVLTGRHGATTEAREKISQLEAQGVRVMVVSADVSVTKDVERICTVIDKEMPQVRGVFHAAGVLDDSVIVNQNAERFRKVMEPKVSGTWNLYNIIENREIDFFVLFSSAASVLGSAGQSNYAAANTFLNSAAHYFSGCGIRTIAINWGIWASTGMTAKRPENIAAIGFNKIEIKDGLSILEKLLYDKHTNTCVIDLNWNTYLARLPQGTNSGFLEYFYAEISGSASPETLNTGDVPESDILKNLRAASSESRLELLVSYIKGAVNRILGSDRDANIFIEEPIMEQGFDSLMSVEFRNLISKELNIALPVGFLFSYPTIRAISDNLRNEFFADDESAENLDTATLSEKESDNLDYIDDLNDDDLESLIKKELG